MRDKWDFGYITYKRERTFNLYSKIEDHANDVHDYLKYLKFGYGRSTDDCSMEIRHNRINREEGLKLISEYDSKTPSTLIYCDFLQITPREFYEIIEPMRDNSIWKKENNHWQVKDSVFKGRDMTQTKFTSEIFGQD